MSFFGSNRLKLGIFAANLDGGFTATTVPERYRLSWQNTRRVAELADVAGFEAQVPLARWRGLGGATNFQGTNYETLTWAAGLGSITRETRMFSTVHVPVIHPIVVAKQAATIDHITGGRFGLNVVCGWQPDEFTMFGAPIMAHEQRYAYAGEWVELVRRLWSEEDEFDYEGRFFNIRKGFSQPKPTRMPPIMNAGQSTTGARFAAKYADMAFFADPQQDIAIAKARIDLLRGIGRDDFDRRFDVWTSAWVICRPTEREAQEVYRHVIQEHGDYGAIDGVPKEIQPDPAKVPPAVLQHFRERILAGFGGTHLIGTPDQIADKLKQYSDAGADGVLLTGVNYLDEIGIWAGELLPRLEALGLREKRRSVHGQA